VGDRNARAHEQTLEDVGGRYGDIMPLREVARALQEAGERAVQDA
jgi:hypothetical protein